MNYSFIVVFIAFLFSGVQISLAQTWEAGVSIGGSGYTGDLNQRGYVKFTDPAFGASLKRNFDGYWALKLSVLKGTVRANDLDSKSEDLRNRGLNFFSPVTEGSLQLEFNFFDFGIDWGQKYISPYVFTGISYFGFNPKAIYEGVEYELKRYGTEVDGAFGNGQEAYKTTSLAIPLGAGVKYRLNNYWNISADFGFRTTFTDHLDDVSRDYVIIDPNTSDFNRKRAFLSDPTGYGHDSNGMNTKIQRGDYRKRDSYFFALFTLSYVFRSKDCPF